MWFAQKWLFLRQDSNRNQTVKVPPIFLVSIRRRRALISKIGCFIVFGNKACSIPSLWGSFWAQLWKRGAWRQAGRARGAELALAAPSSPFQSCVSCPPHCTAPHTSWALSEAPALFYLPALKRAEKRVREWVWDGMCGQVESISCYCSVLPFIFRDRGNVQLRERCK